MILKERFLNQSCDCSLKSAHFVKCNKVQFYDVEYIYRNILPLHDEHYYEYIIWREYFITLEVNQVKLPLFARSIEFLLFHLSKLAKFFT